MMNIITEQWQLIRFAQLHGANVTNEKGERVKAVTEPYPDAVRCYVGKSGHYYLSSAENQNGLLFDSKPYDQWCSEKVFELE